MYYLIILIFTQFILLFPQNIDLIKIQGNEKTKNYIILREIKQKINEELNEENITKDKNRIYNLGLFSSVDIQVIENTYLVTVSEIWYIWPFPIIEYDDNEEFSYGGGFIHNNFRGRNENVASGMTIGNVEEYFLWYKNPWISGDHNSIEIGIYDESLNHHTYNIIEKNKGIFLEGGFYRGYENKFNSSIYYENKSIQNVDIIDTNKDSLDSKYLYQTNFDYIGLVFNYIYDTRDIYIDPSFGILFDIELNNTFGLNELANIYSVKGSFNIYKSLYEDYLNPVFRYRLLSKIQYSKKDLPIFRKDYIGGSRYVRGYYPNPSENCRQNSCVLGDDLIDNPKGLIEVDNFIINTFEIQNTIIERKEYKDKIEIGIDFILFADLGIGYNMENRKNILNNSLFGYGAGLRIFFMGAVIKLDYAFSRHGISRLHLF